MNPLVRVAPLALLLAGCAGGMPLLYPAHTLSQAQISAQSGVSGNFIVGSLANDMNGALGVKSPPAPCPPSCGLDPTYAKGALVEAAVSPGLAPFVAARVGIGQGFEGGITYTGGHARLDVRKSFDWRDVSLSVGLGATAAFYDNPDFGALLYVDMSEVHGYGVDVPVIVGWQSTAKIYSLWVGIRGGWDHTDLNFVTTEGLPQPENGAYTLSADRFYGGGVVGLRAGFRHVHAAIELDAEYQTVSGAFNGTTATISGITLVPAGAIGWTF